MFPAVPVEEAAEAIIIPAEGTPTADTAAEAITDNQFQKIYGVITAIDFFDN